jgi:hypothetical protein
MTFRKPDPYEGAPPGLRAALRLHSHAARRQPTDADRRLPPSTLPGRQPHHVDGQLSLDQEAHNDDAA